MSVTNSEKRRMDASYCPPGLVLHGNGHTGGRTDTLETDSREDASKQKAATEYTFFVL